MKIKKYYNRMQTIFENIEKYIKELEGRKKKLEEKAIAGYKNITEKDSKEYEKITNEIKDIIEAQKYLGIATAVIEDYAVEKQYCRIPMKDIEEMYNEIYGDIL